MKIETGWGSLLEVNVYGGNKIVVESNDEMSLTDLSAEGAPQARRRAHRRRGPHRPDRQIRRVMRHDCGGRGDLRQRARGSQTVKHLVRARVTIQIQLNESSITDGTLEETLDQVEELLNEQFKVCDAITVGVGGDRRPDRFFGSKAIRSST